MFAIIIRGLRPSCSAKTSARACAFLKLLSSFMAFEYTPVNDFISALWRPNATSKASLISPRVALALAASTAKANKLSAAPLPDILFLAAYVTFCKQVATALVSLSTLIVLPVVSAPLGYLLLIFVARPLVPIGTYLPQQVHLVRYPSVPVFWQLLL